jgi:hypothetical protein
VDSNDKTLDWTPSISQRIPSSFSQTIRLVPTKPTQTRLWRDKRHKWKVEAEFQGTENSKIFLRRMNGTIVEYPIEKISQEDWCYIVEVTSRSPADGDSRREEEGSRRPSGSKRKAKKSEAPQKKEFKWLDFFRDAGCDDEDCVVYAAKFESEQIHHSKLANMDEHTLQALGIEEGDIVRVLEAVQNRRSTSSMRLEEPAPVPVPIQTTTSIDAEVSSMVSPPPQSAAIQESKRTDAREGNPGEMNSGSSADTDHQVLE